MSKLKEEIAMLVKKCPECDEKSYSASDQGEWICPSCKEDLTAIKPRPAGVDDSGDTSDKN